MGIVLFAIIGATIKAGVAYWLCFSAYSFWKLIKGVGYIVKTFDED